MNLTKQGKILIGSVSGGVAVLIGLMIWLCWPVAIVIGALYIGFIIFNIALNAYCNKLIDKNNAETEKYAKLNDDGTGGVKYISPEMYDRLMNRDGADLGDNIIINKEEVTLI